MAESNQIQTTGANPATQATSKNSGTTVNSGPYEAIVVGHVVGPRMGQLQIYVPDLGGTRAGDRDNPLTASYCSPFYGTTYGTDSQQQAPGAFSSGQSYGMWMVPPDVGNKVLVVFAAGDINRAYWIGCIYDSPSHHMVPGNARNIGGQSNTQIDPTQSGPLTSSATSNSVLPVVEFSTGSSSTWTPDGLTDTPRYANPVQSMILIGQGLDADPVRGAISSSSLREAPSNVYGISTPGRSATGNKPQVPGATDVKAEQTVIGRVGGHTFVMDDGDAETREFVITQVVMIGHDCRFPADQTALGINAPVGYSLNELFEQRRIVLGHRYIIEEEQRFGTGTEHIVDTHGHQIDSDRRMLFRSDRHLEFGPNAVGPRDQNRFFVVACEKLLGKIQSEQPGKTSVVPEHSRGKRPMHQLG